MTKFDLFLAVVSHRVVSAPTVHSLWRYKTNSPMTERTDLGMFIGDALIGRGRSQAATAFLEKSDAPYMIFLDDDIVFEHQDIEKIYSHMVSGYDVIGGIYAVKGASQLSSYGWGGRLEITNDIQEIEYLATGFMGISRRILKKILDEYTYPDTEKKMILCNPNDWAKCWPFFESRAYPKEWRQKGGDNIYISEDWDFCEKARRVGCKIYADTSVKVGHLREQVYTPDDVLVGQQKAILDKELYGGLRKQQELLLSIDTDLSEYLKIPLKVAQRRMETCQIDLAKEWNTHSGKADSFYKSNETYLFDLAVFNKMNHYFQDRVAQLINNKGQNVLDIGCGIGTLVFIMEAQGNKATGYDINNKAISFAKFKKRKYKLGGHFTTEKPDYSKFDFITAIDVLEHIEDLEGFLKELGSKVERGTKFYHSDYFPKGTDGKEVWPMHFEENEKNLSKWLKEAGFIEWDDRWCVRG